MTMWGANPHPHSKGVKRMSDIEKVIKALESQIEFMDFTGNSCAYSAIVMRDALELLKELKSSLGIKLTADSITFISTGTAQQGESRGILLGKYAMHEWLEKELLYRGLLTDDIRAVFNEAKRQEGR